MSWTGLSEFVNALEKAGEIHRINTFADPVLEMAEIADRIAKNRGKALLFENNGTDFPVLMNAFGSKKRMAMALGREDPGQAGSEILDIIDSLSDTSGGIAGKILKLLKLGKTAGYMPVKLRRRGLCQQVIVKNPDLGILPVLQCWPYDGGRFVTLPMVHTRHPETGKTNVGMYRMQILGKNSTAMHWQRHKTGAAHFGEWERSGKIMPVAVALGGDPVYTFAATAPLPENIDEYILAGFLRKRRVNLVKCITCDLYVPDDADIVIEGFIDPAAGTVTEGPFGDHTGFYSLADTYPVFNVTCITHSHNAIYPATVVGIPPQEDAWLAKATEQIFLTPMKIAFLPELTDLHMPEPGVAHNLVIVKINKSYPGQGMKVISSLLGAGQMMFTKYLAVVSGDVDIRNYRELLYNIFINTCFERDILFTRGPLDVLDHSSDSFSYGGKAGIDATIKLPEEREGRGRNVLIPGDEAIDCEWIKTLADRNLTDDHNTGLLTDGIPVVVISVNPSQSPGIVERVAEEIRKTAGEKAAGLIIAVDHTVDVNDLYMVAWQVLGNSDPVRDHFYINPATLLVDGTIKYYRRDGFSRKWPNVVCSDTDTIDSINNKWGFMGFEDFYPSPSLRYKKLHRRGRDFISEDVLDLVD